MTDAERLRREFGRLFDPQASDTELAERRRRWVAALHEAWDRLSLDEKEWLADLREYLHLISS